MDLLTHRARNWFRQTFPARILRLPKASSLSRVPHGLWMAPSALMLAIWAHQGSQEEGRIQWLRDSPPTLETWHTMVKDRGFVPVEDPAWREKAILEMPENSRRRGSGWISEDRYTIAVRADGDWLYFALGGPKDGSGGSLVPRELWEDMGLGWEALAKFTQIELPRIRTQASRVPERRAWRDPRSIVY